MNNDYVRDLHGSCIVSRYDPNLHDTLVLPAACSDSVPLTQRDAMTEYDEHGNSANTSFFEVHPQVENNFNIPALVYVANNTSCIIFLEDFLVVS